MRTDQPAHEPGDPPSLIGGRYEIERVLGSGASARTLLCLDRETGGRVAVKELHFEHLEDWKHLELFEREAQVLSLLDHPAIPKILASLHDGADATEVYLVQEYVEGASLKERMETGPMLGQQEVHDLALGLLDVLEYLHGRAPPVLHRDIKPSNVLLRPDGQVVLIDFGGVRLGWRPMEEEGATVVGTFGYMPPEQLMGQAGPASDLYALGATLLHLVTGRPPTDFPYDSGRIEVPANLPAGEGLRRLIEALLRPAPRDRPASAESARRLMMDGEPANAVASTETHPAPRPPASRRSPMVVSQYGVSPNGPRYVDMGPPTRDPEGEFADVYRNLVNPLFPARRLWSEAMHSFWRVLAGVLTAVSFGVFAAWYSSTVRSRKLHYTDIFREGETTQGVIRSSQRGGMWSTFRYEFEVGGTTYVAQIEYATEMAQFWGPEDPVPVLYDPDDPQRSCFVYR